MSTSTAKRRGPYAKTAMRRAGIGRAALELVLEAGHQKVTAEAVARRAGVTTATVNYHFPTRDELLVAALDAREATYFTEESLAAMEADETFDLREVVVNQASSRRYLALYAAMAAAAAEADHPAFAWMKDHVRNARELLANYLRLLQSRGEAHPDVEPERFGREMSAIWDGLQTQWLADDSFDLGEAVVEAMRALTRADIMDAKRALESLAAEL